MSIKRMLVDAVHPEETRIVVTAGNRLEEFDFESATRHQLRGNIYLAKVTRVEPSLQAAFIEYGGNRHGFLPFSEIHPDYYQIPVADREALLLAEQDDDDDHDVSVEENISSPESRTEPDTEADLPADDGSGHIQQVPSDQEPVELIGGSTDGLDEVSERRKPSSSHRRYRIQEVIKRAQIMLVQVVKEERGNKGAALTTYLSLAGRYSVLMPNTARGGGISRKITNAADRKRLKEITADLEVPRGMGVILRTAGASRTKTEVKRDFEYLMRLWESVRTLTLQSQAPCLIYEEGSLIKRTIRDLYNKDIEEILVAGESAYREAKDFMKMIMPSYAKNVRLYRDEQPLFSKYGIETQLDQMFSPTITLPSGGYLVINPTEALVSIDVNSGRSTREHNIEDTALQTNLEAAEEVARQLRLRDLAGLVVIDFIDMMENRSNRAVERKLKDCLKNDRARIQVGRISHFGLMEMSRQRIRFGVVESSTHKCPLCDGTGLVRSTESLALMIMRHIEDHVLRKQEQSINVRVPIEVALYILNVKRETLTMLEMRNRLSITITADSQLAGQQFFIEKGEARALPHANQHTVSHVRVDSAVIENDTEDNSDAEITKDEEYAAVENSNSNSGRRRRRHRGHADRENNAQQQLAESGGDEVSEEVENKAGEAVPIEAQSDDEPRKRRRRGRRGGRHNRRENEENSEIATDGVEQITEIAAAASEAEIPAEPIEVLPPVLTETEAAIIFPLSAEKPRRTRSKKIPEAVPIDDASQMLASVEAAVTEKTKRKPRARKPKADSVPVEEAEQETSDPIEAVPEPASAKPVRSRRVKKELPAEGIVVSSSVPMPELTSENTSGVPKKKIGWWQRRLGLG